MVLKDMGFDWDVLFERDDYFDINNHAKITESDYKRYARMLEEEPIDDNYKAFLSFLIKKSSTGPLEKRKWREKDDNAPETDSDCYTDEKETDDLENRLWFQKLIEDGKSYVLEVERDGLPFLKYEGENEGSDKENGFSDYKRKLRNRSKKKHEPSNESSFISSEEEGEDPGWRELRDGSKKDNGPSKESRFTLSEEEAEDSGRGKLKSGAKKSRGPSNKSRCASSEEESEDLGLRNLRIGSRKYNGPMNESRFTLSEEEADDSVRRKLRSWSSKYNGPSNESKFTLNEEAEDSGRKKLRSGLEKNNGASNESRFTSSEEEAEDLGKRKLRSGGAKKKKMESGETSSVETDPDYRILMRGIECVEGWAVFEDRCDRVVLEESNSEESNNQRDDEWGQFVEILDRTTFYNGVNLSPYVEAATDGLKNTNKDNRYSNPGMQFEFRRQLIAALRKPYDKEEYDKLWEDIKLRKPEERHLELRHGRDRSCSTDKYGKSYLDHYPDLKKELSQLGDNKPKRLNLLRGFFFWIQKASCEGSFLPWRDAECRSIVPKFG